MPYKMRKNKDGTYRVTSPSGTKAKRTTKKKAEAQIRLLQMKEHEEEYERPKRSGKRAKRTSY